MKQSDFLTKQRFGIRKLSVGVASCLLGFSMLSNQQVNALETGDSAAPSTTTTTTSQSTTQAPTTTETPTTSASATNTETPKVEEPTKEAVTTATNVLSVQPIRVNTGVAADDFSAYNNVMQNLKFQVKNTGTTPITNAYVTLEVPLTNLKAPSTVFYAQYWASTAPYTEIDGPDGPVRQYKLSIGTVAPGKTIELPFNVQSNYAITSDFETPLHFKAYGDEGTEQGKELGASDIALTWKVKELAPTSIALTDSSMGYKNNSANDPYIADWGVIDQAYVDQAKRILESGARKVIPYVATKSGMVQIQEFAKKRGILNADEYTQEFIMSEIDTLHKMLGDSMGGIFLDEFSNGYSEYAKTVDWSKELVSKIRAKYGKDFVIIGNPGSVVTDAVLEADLNGIITYEGTAERYLSTPNLHPNGIAKEDPSRLWHIVYGITKDNIDAVLAKADAENINHLYLSDQNIIRSVRDDGTAVQSPYEYLPSDWVVEAMKKWQDRKTPSTSEGTTINPNSRYISPISYWYPDETDPQQRANFAQMLTLEKRLGYMLLSSNNATWNVRASSVLKYTITWPNTYQGTGTPKGSDFLYRLKIPNHVKILASKERPWQDGLDGYFYSPALVGPPQNFFAINKSTKKDETPWTIEFDIVDAITKKVISPFTSSSITHNVHYREYGSIDKTIVTDTGQVLEPKATLYPELLSGSAYSTSHAEDMTDEDGKVWSFQSLATDSAPEKGQVQVGKQTITLVYTAKAGSRVIAKYVDEDGKEIIPTNTIKDNGTQVGTHFEYNVPSEIKDANGLVYTLAVGDTKSVGQVTDQETVLTYIYLKKTGGSVTAKYVNDKGEAIIPKSPVKVNAQVGTAYSTTHEEELVDADGKVWVYDKLAANSAPAEGTVTSEDQDVIYQYSPKLGGQVIVKYVDDAGNDVIPSAVIQPKDSQVGTQYSAPKETEITDANGIVYVLKATAPNETGRVASGETTVTFIYTKKLGGNVSAHYQTVDGATLKPTKVVALNAPVGSTYTSDHDETIIDKDGKIWIYSRLDTGSAAMSGTVKSRTQAVTYLYEPQQGGKVLARFVDTNGNTILPDQIILPDKTQVGTSYLTVRSPEVLSSNGKTYSLKQIPTNTEGRVSKEDTIITFVYSQNLDGNVTARYVNSFNGQAILPSVLVKSNAPAGDAYTTDHPNEITDENGYIWTYKGLGNGSAPAEGQVKPGSQLVTYVYDPKLGKGVVAKYLDENGNELQPSVTLLADNTQQGTPYSTSKQLEIRTADGKVYVLKAIEGNEVGKVGSEPTTVTYIYTPKTGGNVTVSYITDAGTAIIPTAVVHLNAQIGTRYETNRQAEITDTDGKVWVYSRLGDGSAAPSGSVTSETKNVIYVYTMKQGEQVASDYYFLNKGLLPTQVIKPKGTQVGVQYQASKPLEVTLSDGLVYVLQKVPHNEEGRVSTDHTLVTYTYVPKKGGLVTANYVTNDGLVLAPSSIIASEKQVGTPYTTTHPAEITDATGRVWVYSQLGAGSAGITGKVADRSQDVIFVYVAKKGGDVISRYIDADGNQLAPDKVSVSAQQVGSDYTVDPVAELTDAEGKVWIYTKLTEDSAPASDKVKTNQTVITFQYAAKPGGKVVARYVDENGNVLTPDKDVVPKGQQVGSKFRTQDGEEIIIDGKKYKIVSHNTPGRIEADDTMITYTLQLIEDDPKILEKPKVSDEPKILETPKTPEQPKPLNHKPVEQAQAPLSRRAARAKLPKTGSRNSNVLTTLGLTSLVSLFYVGKRRRSRK